MKCEIEGCNKEKPNTRNRKYCKDHSKELLNGYKRRWARNNKKYHLEYNRSWRKKMSELES